MASPTSPTHGKHCAIYRFRPDGFKGAGLNDVTWGTGFNDSSSAYYEVEIDAEGTPDTFKWRNNGGEYTTGVSITGSAQTLDTGQTITFAATTGHTLGDRWVIGNLKDEACTESGDEGQITDSTKRLLNPNASPTFSDSGSETVLVLDHVRGNAKFTGNVTVVTATGNNGYIPTLALEKVGYLIDWNLSVNLEMADMSYAGQKWKNSLPGMAGGSGGANAFFIGSDSFFDALKEAAEGTEKYYLLQLFHYDPDQDQTGDHINCWATISGIGVNAPIAELVKEAVTFQIHGMVSFTENT